MEEKFREKLMPEPNSGCWLWLGAMGVNGYGQMHIKTNGKWRMGYAHRISWEIHNGPIPDKKHILHKCDNPSCANPHHLFIGDQSSNMKDKVRKGRHPRGEDCSYSRLTENDIKKIRNDKRTQAEIGNEYGVTQGMISRIKLYKAWRYV